MDNVNTYNAYLSHMGNMRSLSPRRRLPQVPYYAAIGWSRYRNQGLHRNTRRPQSGIGRMGPSHLTL